MVPVFDTNISKMLFLFLLYFFSTFEAVDAVSNQIALQSGEELFDLISSRDTNSDCWSKILDRAKQWCKQTDEFNTLKYSLASEMVLCQYPHPTVKNCSFSPTLRNCIQNSYTDDQMEKWSFYLTKANDLCLFLDTNTWKTYQVGNYLFMFFSLLFYALY